MDEGVLIRPTDELGALVIFTEVTAARFHAEPATACQCWSE